MNKRELDTKIRDLRIVRSLPREQWARSLQILDIPDSIIEEAVRARAMTTVVAYLNEEYRASLRPCRRAIPRPTPHCADTLPRLFGVEIECFNASRSAIIESAAAEGLSIQSSAYNHRDEGFAKIVSDGSINGVEPNEVVMPPLDNFSDLIKVTRALRAAGAKVNRTCGLHVHIDARRMPPRQAVRIAQNYYHLRDLINASLAPSRRDNTYCHICVFNYTEAQVNELPQFESWSELLLHYSSRYLAVNFQAYARHKTLEFRQHQGSINFSKIKRWVLFIMSLVEWSSTHILTADVHEKSDPALNGLHIELLRELPENSRD